jgi:hypothetical protein
MGRKSGEWAGRARGSEEVKGYEASVLRWRKCTNGEDEQTGESQEGWVKARGGSMPDRAESGRGEGVI